MNGHIHYIHWCRGYEPGAWVNDPMVVQENTQLLPNRNQASCHNEISNLLLQAACISFILYPSWIILAGNIVLRADHYMLSNGSSDHQISTKNQAITTMLFFLDSVVPLLTSRSDRDSFFISRA